MKSILILFITFLTVESSFGNCEVFQSIDLNGSFALVGNAVPVTKQVLVMNERLLFRFSKNIKLRSRDNGFEGEVLFRDYHTDLAFVKILGREVTPCSPSAVDVDNATQLFLKGYQAGEGKIIGFPVVVKNPNSSRSSVPGLASVLEFQFVHPSYLDPSMSGAALVDINDGFLGILSQKTWTGAGLVIHLKTIREILDRGNVPRLYELSEDKKSAFYGGLEIYLANQTFSKMAGNPHEHVGPLLVGNPHERKNPIEPGNPHEGRRGLVDGRGNPHERVLPDGMPGLRDGSFPEWRGNPHERPADTDASAIFVSMQFRMSDSVLAKVADINLVRKYFPGLAKSVAQGTFIDILGVNNQSVRTGREILQSLENRGMLAISEFVVRGNGQGKSDPANMLFLESFFDLLEKEHGEEFAKSIQTNKSKLKLLVQKALDNRATKRRNNELLQSLDKEWLQLQEKMNKKRHSEDLIQEIFKLQGLMISLTSIDA